MAATHVVRLGGALGVAVAVYARMLRLAGVVNVAVVAALALDAAGAPVRPGQVLAPAGHAARVLHGATLVDVDFAQQSGEAGTAAVAVVPSDFVDALAAVLARAASCWQYALVYVVLAVLAVEAHRAVAVRYCVRGVAYASVLALSPHAERRVAQRPLHSFSAETREIVARLLIYNHNN